MEPHNTVRAIGKEVSNIVIKAIISNKSHPEFGQATVPFPIPDSEYDHTIGLLEDMEIGSPTAQDCRVDRLEGRNAALDLILNNAGTITPYGVVYDNGMKLEPLYDGRHFPAYLYESPQMAIEIRSKQDGTVTGFLCLPCPDLYLQRMMQRAGNFGKKK